MDHASRLQASRRRRNHSQKRSPRSDQRRGDVARLADPYRFRSRLSGSVMKREIKNTTLNIRTVPAIRKMVAKLAAADHLSVAQTIEKLIRAEHERKQQVRAS
jgi:hypothetical protein